MPKMVSGGKEIKRAIEEGLSYEMAKVKYGIRIRKQSYLALKKVATGDKLTERQRREIKRILETEALYRSIVEEFKLRERVKRAFIGEGDIILSTSRHTGEATEIYGEVVINATVVGDAKKFKDKNDFMDAVEYNLYRAYRESLRDLFDNKPIAEAIPIRVDIHEDFELLEDVVLDYEVKKPMDKSGVLHEDYFSFVIDKGKRTYDYSDDLLDLFVDNLERRDWEVKIIRKKGGKNGNNKGGKG